jgi:hypothetical protein
MAANNTIVESGSDDNTVDKRDHPSMSSSCTVNIKHQKITDHAVG